MHMRMISNPNSWLDDGDASDKPGGNGYICIMEEKIILALVISFLCS